jgi:predicted DCC family thiol-disulfide oxidoreductase YuxK
MVIPAFIRNPIYDFIAANRYKWFGKKEVCMIPTPELKSLFLNDEN